VIETKTIWVVSCDVCHEELMYDHDDGEQKLYPPILDIEEAQHYLDVNFYRWLNGERDARTRLPWFSCPSSHLLWWLLCYRVWTR